MAGVRRWSASWGVLLLLVDLGDGPYHGDAATRERLSSWTARRKAGRSSSAASSSR